MFKRQKKKKKHPTVYLYCTSSEVLACFIHSQSDLIIFRYVFSLALLVLGGIGRWRQEMSSNSSSRIYLGNIAYQEEWVRFSENAVLGIVCLEVIFTWRFCNFQTVYAPSDYIFLIIWISNHHGWACKYSFECACKPHQKVWICSSERI